MKEVKLLDTTGKTVNTLNRKTIFTRLNIKGVSGFTELVLTEDEQQKLNEVKSTLVGTNVKFTKTAFNRSDATGLITDIRIVVTAYDICPCAVVNFPSKGYSRLRFLADIEPVH